MSGGAIGRRQMLLLLVLLHFGFKLSQLLADFIICFQVSKLLIQGLLFTEIMAFSLSFHLIDTTLEDSKRAIASSSLPLSS